MSTKYEKIAKDEGIDHSRNISTARFCDVCKFCFFVDRNFNYEDYAYNRCHNLLMMPYSLDNIVILRVNDVSFSCILLGISRSEALRRLNNANNLGKRGVV